MRPWRNKNSGVLVSLWLLTTFVLAAESDFHFAYDIAPIFARHGCAAADCHGGATGRGQFKLSLFATDSRADYRAITEDLESRRVSFIRPEQSLLLRKPTRQVKHGGGHVLRISDSAYQTLHQWIDAGAPYQTGASFTLTELELNDAGQVWASFESADGAVNRRDVTSTARFSSTNTSVLEVSEQGEVTLQGRGQAWLIAQYAGLAARSRYVSRFDGSSETTSSSTHPLDTVWRACLNELGLEPVGRAVESVLARRLYLDLAGRVPSPEEFVAFLALPADTRIGVVAERLLASKDFVKAFGPALWNWFEVPMPGKDTGPRQETYRELRRVLLAWLESGNSIDVLAKLVLGEGRGRAFVKRFEDPRDRAEFVSRSLLGVRIDCARCHNHPQDRWRQDQHLKFSALFADPRPDPKQPGTMMAGKFFLPGDQQAVRPELLPIATVPAPEAASLTWLILEGGRSQFERNVANRMFASVFGKPLVDSPDDHRLTNPAVYESLLDAVTEGVRQRRGDLRRVLHLLVTSEMYAMSSQPPSDDVLSSDPALRYLARREARPLTDHQRARSVEQVLGVPLADRMPPESPLARQLAVLNSGSLQDALAEPGNQVEAIVDFESASKAQLDALYRLILSRAPSHAEREQLLPMLTGTSEPHALARDLAFALLTSREFGSSR